MVVANRQIIQGTLFAIVATFFWAFNFIAPYVTGPYSIEDMVLARYVIAGVMGLIFLLFYRRQLRGMSLGQRLSGMALGVNGYLLYSICIAGSVICSGPALIAAFVGLVPLLQTVIGNLQSRRLRWKSIVIPMILIIAGLALLNMRALAAGPAAGHPLSGLAFALGAVASWLSFSVINQKAVAKLAPATTQVWTCLMMIGAGIGALVLLPLAVGAGKALVREPDLLNAPVLLFYAWALIIAFSSSVLGAGAWNAATRRLPMVLSGQFVALESLFATVLGYAFLGQWPGLSEIIGMALVVLGAARSLHIILASKDIDVPSPALLEEIAHEYDR
jgi:drug/metabolite transporter (DMT)-like permease